MRGFGRSAGPPTSTASSLRAVRRRVVTVGVGVGSRTVTPRSATSDDHDVSVLGSVSHLRLRCASVARRWRGGLMAASRQGEAVAGLVEWIPSDVHRCANGNDYKSERP